MQQSQRGGEIAAHAEVKIRFAFAADRRCQMKNDSCLCRHRLRHSLFFLKKLAQVANHDGDARISRQIVGRRRAVYQRDARNRHRRATRQRQLPLRQQAARQTHAQETGTARDDDMTRWRR